MYRAGHKGAGTNQCESSLDCQGGDLMRACSLFRKHLTKQAALIAGAVSRWQLVDVTQRG